MFTTGGCWSRVEIGKFDIWVTGGKTVFEFIEECLNFRWWGRDMGWFLIDFIDENCEHFRVGDATFVGELKGGEARCFFFVRRRAAGGDEGDFV